MGNDQSTSDVMDKDKDKDSSKMSSYLNQNMRVIKQTDHDAYGEIRIMENELTGELFSVKVKYFIDQQSQDNYVKQCLLRKELGTNEHILPILDVETESDSNYCSKNSKVSVIFPYFPMSLANLIDQHRKNKKQIDQNQILLIIASILDGLDYLYVNGLEHADIRPETILISNEGAFLISDVQFMTNLSQYRRLLLAMNCKPYLSPHLFQQLQHRSSLGQYEESFQFSADIFSLGLICLEMMIIGNITNQKPANINNSSLNLPSTLSIQDVYDWDNYTVNQQLLQNILNASKDNYSSELLSLVAKMLQFDDALRISVRDIQSQLMNFDDIQPLFQQLNEQGHSKNIPIDFDTQTFNQKISKRVSDNSTVQESNHKGSQKYEEDTKYPGFTDQKSKGIHSRVQSSPNQSLPNNNSLFMMSEEMEEYWERNMQSVHKEVQKALEESDKVKMEFNSQGKPHFRQLAADKRMEITTKKSKNQSDNNYKKGNSITALNDNYQYQSQQQQYSPLLNLSFHSHRKSDIQSLHSRSNLSSHNVSQQQISPKQYISHSETKSLLAIPGRDSSVFQRNSSQKASPLQQDYIDICKGSNAVYEEYLNEYKRLVNQQNTLL